MAQESYEPLVFESTERAFQQLSCANCGEPLQMPRDDEVLTCELCGQGHKSLAPPPPTSRATGFETGDGVAVLWGDRWWSAHIVETLERNRWRVHYEGWAPSFDEIVDETRLRALDYVPGSSIIPPVFEPNLKVKRANILSAVSIVLVIMAGFGFLAVWAFGGNMFTSQDDHTTSIEAARLGAITGRTPGIAIDGRYLLQPDQLFYVKWGGSWYRGTVLEVLDQNRVLIRYMGWGDSQDEIVTRDRLRAMP